MLQCQPFLLRHVKYVFFLPLLPLVLRGVFCTGGVTNKVGNHSFASVVGTPDIFPLCMLILDTSPVSKTCE